MEYVYIMDMDRLLHSHDIVKSNVHRCTEDQIDQQSVGGRGRKREGEGQERGGRVRERCSTS